MLSSGSKNVCVFVLGRHALPRNLECDDTWMIDVVLFRIGNPGVSYLTFIEESVQLGEENPLILDSPHYEM